MSFKLYIRKHGTLETKKWIQARDFPRSDYRELKAFTLRNNIPLNVEEEILELHDLYHMRFVDLKFRIYHFLLKIKGVA